MVSFLRRWLAIRPATPKTAYPRFRPALSALDDRITPTFGFAAQQTFAIGGNARSVAVADFNGDGRPDLAAAIPNAGKISVRLNTTAAGATTSAFSTASYGYTVGNTPTTVTVADFNGDGRPDLAAAIPDANKISILLNTTANGAATPSFSTTAMNFSVGLYPRSMAVGDFNSDGRADFVTANEDADTVTVRLNTTVAGATTLTFSGSQNYTVGDGPDAVAVGDFDGDGRPDIAAANGNAATVTVRLNTTTVGATATSFNSAQTLTAGNFPIALTVADFDGDGRPDIATSNDTSDNVWVRRNTTPSFATSPSFTLASFAAAQIIGVGDGPASVAAADFNGDGRTDFIAANRYTDTVSVRLNTTAVGATSFTFAATQTYAVGLGAVSVAAADFNADGRADFVTAGSDVTTLSVRLNTSDGLLTTGPVLTGQFGTGGVWAYNRALNQWAQLTSSNADLLAVAPNGNVVANFGGNGVWYYRPATGWTQLNGTSASAIAIDKYGNPYVSWDGYGTFVYLLHTNSWTALTNTGTAGANKLAVAANGDVIVNYASYGLYRFRWSIGWTQIDNKSTVAMAIGENGDVAASFNGFGTYLNKAATGWKQINGVTASSLAVAADGAVAAVFPGYGVAKYIPYANGWASLTDNGAGKSVAMDLFGNVFASFSGAGVWEFNPSYGWRQRTTSDAGILGLGR